MPESLDYLRNRFIHRIEKIHDYVQIYFDDGSVLNIFNDFSIGCSKFGDLIGCEVVEIIINQSAIYISLGGFNPEVQHSPTRVNCTDEHNLPPLTARRAHNAGQS